MLLQALQAGLSYRSRLAGVVCLSGWLPRGRDGPATLANLGWDVPPDLASTPVLVCHGEADGVVLPALNAASCAALGRGGYSAIGRQTFPGLGHEASPAVLDAVCRVRQRSCFVTASRPAVVRASAACSFVPYNR